MKGKRFFIFYFVCVFGYNKEKKEETNIIYLPFVWFVK